MADNLSKRGPQDRARIDVNQDWELRYWSKELSVSADEIRSAVHAVGFSTEKVREYLRGRKIDPHAHSSCAKIKTDGGHMKSFDIAKTATAFAIIATFAGCSTWHRMDTTEGTVAGGAGGAVAGAVVGGPVGAVVGGVGGAYVGHETAGKDTTVTSSTSYSSTSSAQYDSNLVRRVQQSLNDKGYNAGSVDGQWGPATEDAVRRFQQASGLPQTGELGGPTLSALGVTPTR